MPPGPDRSPAADPAGLTSLVVAALDAADNLVAVLTPRDAAPPRLVFANGAVARLLGFDPMAAPDRAARLLLGDAAPRIAACARDDAQRQELLEVKRADGARRIVGARLMPMRDAAGAATVVLLGRDITAKRQRAAAETATRILLLSTLAASQAAVLVAGLDGRIAFANPRCLALLGRGGAALDGQDAVALVDAPDRPALRAALATQDAEGRPFDIAARLLRPNAPPLDAWLHVALVERAEIGRVRVVTLRAGAAARPAGPPLRLACRVDMPGLRGDGAEDPGIAAQAIGLAESVLAVRLGAAEAWCRLPGGDLLLALAGDDRRAIRDRAVALAEDIRRCWLAIPALAGRRDLVVGLDADALPPAAAEDLAAAAPAIGARLAGRRAARQAAARRAVADILATLGAIARPALGRGAEAVRAIDLPAGPARDLAAALLTLPPSERAGLDPTSLRVALAADILARPAAPATILLPIAWEALEETARAPALLAALRRLVPAAPARLVPVLAELPPEDAAPGILAALQQLQAATGGPAGIAVDSIEALPVDPAAGLAAILLTGGPPLLAALRRRPKPTEAALARLAGLGLRLVATEAWDGDDAQALLRAGAAWVLPAAGSPLDSSVAAGAASVAALTGA